MSAKCPKIFRGRAPTTEEAERFRIGLGKRQNNDRSAPMKRGGEKAPAPLPAWNCRKITSRNSKEQPPAEKDGRNT